ncbi:uncharacterized protein J3R85_019804 [Psidium guajava]|nr:uncharacterized protein J3R85_019804 [Psidium guajava]
MPMSYHWPHSLSTCSWALKEPALSMCRSMLPMLCQSLTQHESGSKNHQFLVQSGLILKSRTRSRESILNFKDWESNQMVLRLDCTIFGRSNHGTDRNFL